MASIVVTDGGGSPRYLKVTGTGVDDGNAMVPSHIVDSIAAALPAGTNNLGDVDILTLVGDSADMDSAAGTDNHGLVAVGLPASGGHVVGGTVVNPFRVEPVASTVLPVSVASFYVPIDTVASVVGNPQVIASIAGVPNVLASIPNVPSVAIASVNVPVHPWTTGSMWSAIARVVGSANDVAPVPARGAGVYNYITSLSVINAAASYGGVVNLQDGTATLHVGYAAPAGGGYAVPFPVPLKPAANATLFLGVPVYSLDLLISISGFQGA